MLKKFINFALFIAFSNCLFALNPSEEDIENLLIQANQFDESRGIVIPWNGSNTESAVFTKLDSTLSGDLILNIVHPTNYSLFLNGVLIYKNKLSDSLQITLKELNNLSDSRTIELAHFADLLNESNLQVRLSKKSELKNFKILGKDKRVKKNSDLKITFLILFFVLALVRIFSKREFDFYFSGNFLRSPRLTLEKFLGDSISPFLLLLAIVLLAIVIVSFIHSFDYFDYEYRKFLSLKWSNEFFKTGLLTLLIIGFLFLKRTLYLFYLWNRQETKNFSSLWRTYLLSFTNLCFWYFLLCSIPLLLLSNLELGNYFQILFFIFAALNAVGGIMTYLNFKIKADLLTVSGILAIDVFPIILLVHLLNF